MIRRSTKFSWPAIERVSSRCITTAGLLVSFSDRKSRPYYGCPASPAAWTIRHSQIFLFLVIPSHRDNVSGCARARAGDIPTGSRQGIEKRRFWSWLQFSSNMGQSEALEQTQAALTESLREHLVSDVPIGVLLSGGIDSSLLSPSLQKCLGKMWRRSLFPSRKAPMTNRLMLKPSPGALAFGIGKSSWIPG